MTMTAKTRLQSPDPDDPNPDLPPEQPPSEVPGTPAPDLPQQDPDELPDAPAPDLPPDTPPDEVPGDLPGVPAPSDPGHDLPPDAPEEVPDTPPPNRPGNPTEIPGTPAPDLPPQDVPSEVPGLPGDPGPAPSPMPGPVISLRPGHPLDAGRLGDMISRAVDSQPWMPRLHTGAEDIAHAGHMIDKGWVTVAEVDYTPAGFIARDGGYIHSLYIAAEAQGSGIGTRLLDDAKTQNDRLELWTLQANRGAQRFYRREGFRPDGESDGAHNEEGLPDMRFVWTREETAKAPDKGLAKASGDTSQATGKGAGTGNAKVSANASGGKETDG